jgi:hypothetical protein
VVVHLLPPHTQQGYVEVARAWSWSPHQRCSFLLNTEGWNSTGVPASCGVPIESVVSDTFSQGCCFLPSCRAWSNPIASVDFGKKCCKTLNPYSVTLKCAFVLE